MCKENSYNKNIIIVNCYIAVLITFVINKEIRKKAVENPQKKINNNNYKNPTNLRMTKRMMKMRTRM